MKIMQIGVIGLSVITSGCSVYSAAKAPEPVKYQKLVIGTPRDQVVKLLGTPTHSKPNSKKPIDNFEFTDGLHVGYKSRALLYIAGDIVTAGLSEIIFWPLEEYLLQGAENQAIVKYDQDDKLQKISVFSMKDQSLLYETP